FSLDTSNSIPTFDYLSGGALSPETHYWLVFFSASLALGTVAGASATDASPQSDDLGDGFVGRFGYTQDFSAGQDASWIVSDFTEGSRPPPVPTNTLATAPTAPVPPTLFGSVAENSPDGTIVGPLNGPVDGIHVGISLIDDAGGLFAQSGG